MEAQKFNTVLDAQLDRIRAMLGTKAGEYATDGDRLANFKTAAALQGITPEEALRGMMAKHTVSINDMIKAGDPTRFSMEQWDEKITDNINYLILLRALVEETCDDGVELYEHRSQ